MLFVLHAIDHSDAPEARLANYDAHKAHAASAAGRGIAVVLGGPLMLDNADRMTGSLAVYDAPDRATIEAFVQEDPFNRFGVWSEARLHRFDPRIGQWIPACHTERPAAVRR